MKKILVCSIVLLASQLFFSEDQLQQPDEDFALLQEAIEIVASMSDNIANLVIQHKNDTNAPEVTKKECVALVQKMTSLVLTILKKQKLKKSSRKINLYSSDSFEERIEHIAQDIFNKVTIG